MTEEELDELYANYPKYEMETISHPEYSTCITTEYGDTIIAYQDRKTDKWYLTEYLMEARPKSMKWAYPMGDNKRTVEIEEMLTLFTKEELFMEML